LAPGFDAFFQNPDHTDVVFRIEGEGESSHAPSHLLGLKLILQDQAYYFFDRTFSLSSSRDLSEQTLVHAVFVYSGFAESRKTAKLDLKKLLVEPASVYGGDGDDFAVFEAKIDEKAASKLVARRSHPRRSRASSPTEIKEAQQPQVDPGTEVDADASTNIDEPVKKKRKVESVLTEVSEVVVKDVRCVPFCPSPRTPS
jgi:hypothetical protein